MVFALAAATKPSRAELVAADPSAAGGPVHTQAKDPSVARAFVQMDSAFS